MTKIVYIDFETYSEVDLRKAGAYAYASHPSTEVICISHAIDNLPVEIWHPGMDSPKMLDGLTCGYKYAAWNVQFDAEIWRYVMCEKYGWPWPGYHNFMDVAARSAYMGLPLGLDAAAGALNAPPKNKDGARLIRLLCKPAKVTKKLTNPKRNWTKENLDAFYAYCIQDTASMREIAWQIKELPYYEEEIRIMDHNMNARGVKCDVEFAKTALALREKRREHIIEEIVELTEGKIDAPTKRTQTLEFLADHGVLTKSIAKDRVKEIVEDEKTPEIVKRILNLYQQYNKTSLSKYNRMLIMACADDRLRGQQQYFGAHTGRWAGRGVQCQNLARGVIKDPSEYPYVRQLVAEGDYDLLCLFYYPDEIMDILSTMIRPAIVAAKGHEFHVSDYSSIEARFAFWLTDDVAGMYIYRELSGKLYESTAASIYKVPMEEVTGAQRAFGKVVALACQYQVGEKTIFTQCKNYGIKITMEECKEAKIAYREKFVDVVQYWDDLESGVIWAMKNPKRILKIGKIAVCFHDKLFRIKLPSGRIMYYYDAQLKWKETPWGELKEVLSYMGIDQYTRKWTRQYTYGGKLFENIVQAIARDLMGEAMVRAEANDMHPVLTVHDEVIIEEPTGKYTISDLNAVMTKLPKWAEGLPIDAEGWTGNFYMKS